ncbi:MAG TPA: MBL fold metallo-hydrolase [Anaerolineales bacterium]|nr:MBL fold metallo-hydrolase [Anaerolineales bacterium]
MNCRITHISTATVLLEIGSVRILTDPVFDPAGGNYQFGYGTGARKLTAPSIKPASLGKIDAVLLSHDHHEDNLDQAGRAFLPNAEKVITTVAGAKRLGNNAVGLKPWQTITISSEDDDSEIKITAVPARHGSLWSHLIVGETCGFVLEWEGQKHGALYISGDTVWFNGIHEIAHRFNIGTILLHIGKASFPITGPIRFTLTAGEAVRIIRVLDPHMAIPVHYEGWNHFREPREKAEAHFIEADLEETVQWLPLGIPVNIEV